MPLAGKGILINFMNVDPDREADFNRWYDKEHLAERVAIPGFLEARRYVADAAAAKYLALYTTETFEALSSQAYRHALANHTPWTLRHVPHFRSPTRALARVTVSAGQGRGAAVALLRLRPQAGGEALRRTVVERLGEVVALDGIVSAHLFESDPALSRPLGESAGADAAGAGDWYVALDATETGVATCIAGERFGAASWGDAAELVSVGTYRLLWDLASADLAR